MHIVRGKIPDYDPLFAPLDKRIIGAIRQNLPGDLSETGVPIVSEIGQRP